MKCWCFRSGVGKKEQPILTWQPLITALSAKPYCAQRQPACPVHFTASPWRFYSAHSTDENMEALGDGAVCPGLHSELMVGRRLEPLSV